MDCDVDSTGTELKYTRGLYVHLPAIRILLTSAWTSFLHGLTKFASVTMFVGVRFGVKQNHFDERYYNRCGPSRVEPRA